MRARVARLIAVRAHCMTYCDDDWHLPDAASRRWPRWQPASKHDPARSSSRPAGGGKPGRGSSGLWVGGCCSQPVGLGSRKRRERTRPWRRRDVARAGVGCRDRGGRGHTPAPAATEHRSGRLGSKPSRNAGKLTNVKIGQNFRFNTVNTGLY